MVSCIDIHFSTSELCSENGTEGFYEVTKSMCDEYVSTLNLTDEINFDLKSVTKFRALLHTLHLNQKVYNV